MMGTRPNRTSIPSVITDCLHSESTVPDATEAFATVNSSSLKSSHFDVAESCFRPDLDILPKNNSRYNLLSVHSISGIFKKYELD